MSVMDRVWMIAALIPLTANCAPDLTQCQFDDAHDYVEAGRIEVLRYMQGPAEEPCLIPGPRGCFIRDRSGPQGYGAEGLHDAGAHVLTAEEVAALTPDDLRLVDIVPNPDRGRGFSVWCQTTGDEPWSFHLTYYGDCTTHIAWGYAGDL